MNRTGIIPLLLLILITSSPPVLIAEVVTQSFDGNRSAVLPGVLLTRRMNTIALNYQQDQYDVKHLKTTLTSATLEPARETESISKKRQQLLISTVYGSDPAKPAFGIEISGASDSINIRTTYPSSNTATRDKTISLQNINFHLGTRLFFDNLGLGLVYKNTRMKAKSDLTNENSFYTSTSAQTEDVEFTSLGWNLLVNLGYLYLSAGEINSTFDIEGIYTGSIFLKSNQTTSVETGN